MNNNELQELAKLAEEKGFKPHSVSTNYTNKYLLGGKNFFINDTCIFLWLCEVQKWLREVHGIYVNSEHDLNPKGDGILYHTNWGFINAPTSEPRNTWYRVGGGYSENEEFKTYEAALEIGVQEALKLINN